MATNISVCVFHKQNNLKTIVTNDIILRSKIEKATTIPGVGRITAVIVAATAVQRKMPGLIYTLWKNDIVHIES